MTDTVKVSDAWLIPRLLTTWLVGELRSTRAVNEAVAEVPFRDVVARRSWGPSERFSGRLNEVPLTVALPRSLLAVTSKMSTLVPEVATWPEIVTEPVRVTPSEDEVPVSGLIARFVAEEADGTTVTSASAEVGELGFVWSRPVMLARSFSVWPAVPRFTVAESVRVTPAPPAGRLGIDQRPVDGL